MNGFIAELIHPGMNTERDDYLLIFRFIKMKGRYFNLSTHVCFVMFIEIGLVTRVTINRREC